MKNKGFTLIELMAVIVLLAILSTGSITLIMKSRKSANLKLAKSMENTITEAGYNVLSYEKIADSELYSKIKSASETNPVAIELEDLVPNYLKTSDLKNPKGESCSGYLLLYGSTSRGYIKCEGLYTSESYSDVYETGNATLTK